MGNLTDLTPHSTNSPDAFQQGERYRHGRALPEHIPCPEHELYRTPTAEDSGRDCGDSTEQQCHDECFGRPQSHSHLYSPTMLRDHLPSRDSFVPHALLEKKEWRERIRHFTWTFFTMTMATGGIANVLYAGMSFCIMAYVQGWPWSSAYINGSLPLQQCLSVSPASPQSARSSFSLMSFFSYLTLS